MIASVRSGSNQPATRRWSSAIDTISSSQRTLFALNLRADRLYSRRGLNRADHEWQRAATFSHSTTTPEVPTM